MSKVKIGDWQKIAKAYTKEVSAVEFQVGDHEFVSVEVVPHISLTDRIALVNTVVSSCCPLPLDYEYDENTPVGTVDAHRKPAMEYLEPVFRATVLQYYTNLDFSAKKADLDAIWDFAGNDDIYYKVTQMINDDLEELYCIASDKLRSKVGDKEELARRVLNLLNRIEATFPRKAVEEFFDVLAQADNLNLDGSGLLHLVGGDDAE